MNNVKIKKIEELVDLFNGKYTCSIPINKTVPVFFKNNVSYIGRSLSGLIQDLKMQNMNPNILISSWNDNEFTIAESHYVWFCNKFHVKVKERFDFLSNTRDVDFLYLEPLKRTIVEVNEVENELLKKFRDVETIQYVEDTIRDYLQKNKCSVTVFDILVKWECLGLVKFLINNKYTYHSYEEADYDYYTKPMKHHIFSEPEMKYFRIVLTEDCDMNCIYCYYSGNKPIVRRTITKEKLFKTIDYIVYLCKKRNRDIAYIQWWGGDPAVNEYLVMEGTEYAKKTFSLNDIDVSFSICSSFVSNNTDKFFDYMIENNFNITISLDGDKEITNKHKIIKYEGKNTFDTTMKSFLYIKDKIGEFNSLKHQWNNNFKGTFKFRSTLFSLDEIKDYENIEKFFLEMNQSFRICITSDENVLLRKEMFIQELIKAVKRAQKNVIDTFINNKSVDNLLPIFLNAHTNPLSKMKFVYSRCGFGGGIIIINPDGYMYSCHRFCDVSDFCIGKIGDDYAVLTNAIKILRDRWLMLYDKCKECEFQSICTGGCAHEAYETFGSIWRTGNCVSKELIQEKMILLFLLEKCYPELLEIKLDVEDCSNVRGVWC